MSDDYDDYDGDEALERHWDERWPDFAVTENDRSERDDTAPVILYLLIAVALFAAFMLGLFAHVVLPWVD